MKKTKGQSGKKRLKRRQQQRSLTIHSEETIQKILLKEGGFKRISEQDPTIQAKQDIPKLWEQKQHKRKVDWLNNIKIEWQGIEEGPEP